MGRPGPDPRARPRATWSAARRYKLPRPPELQRGRPQRQVRRACRTTAPLLTEEQIDQLQLDYQGRDRLAARRRRPRRQAGRRRSEDDRSAQEHDDRVPLRQRLAAGRAPDPRRQVPALRGVAAGAADHPRPRRPAGRDRSAARSRTSTSPRRCSTWPTPSAGRKMDGVSLMPTDPRSEQAPEPRARDRGARAAVRRADPGQPLGPPLQGRAHRPLHLRRLDARPGEEELYDRKRSDPYQLASVADPGLRGDPGATSRRSSRGSRAAPASAAT